MLLIFDLQILLCFLQLIFKLTPLTLAAIIQSKIIHAAAFKSDFMYLLWSPEKSQLKNPNVKVVFCRQFSNIQKILSNRRRDLVDKSFDSNKNCSKMATTVSEFDEKPQPFITPFFHLHCSKKYETWPKSMTEVLKEIKRGVPGLSIQSVYNT